MPTERIWVRDHLLDEIYARGVVVDTRRESCWAGTRNRLKELIYLK
jgi:hypothetical protein